ncbi:MAG: DNA adenine methylase [Eubacterium sp.]|nr:DNA adenine methylase [Eubacterium sp.]
MKKDYNIKSTHYLGSKLRMLQAIKEAIDKADITDGVMCDLFSGSGVVSEYMLQYRDVISVDIQNYSQVYSLARLSGFDSKYDIDDIVNQIKISSCRKYNTEIFNVLTAYESSCISHAKEGKVDQLYEIIEKGSLYAYLNDMQYSDGDLSQSLEAVFSNIKQRLSVDGKTDSLDTIVTRYYGGLYFSFSQALDIDAIASYAYSQEKVLKNKILAALLGATTDVVNTVGKQFAQPLKVRKKDGTLKLSLLRKIISDREMDVFNQFAKWLSYYLAIPKPSHQFDVICNDYAEVLRSLTGKNISVIYADPPYTRYHYSRYYHILETICLHDNPTISTTFPNGKGGISRAIYRDDRHQSPFCIKSKAAKAFEQLFLLSKEAGAALVLSYSPYDNTSGATPRMMSIDDLACMAKRYYDDVSVVSPGQFMHSRFNSSDNNYEINYEAERLLICK